MKKIFPTALVSLLLPFTAHADFYSSDITGSFDPLGQQEIQYKPKMVMVQVELIELDQTTLTKLLFEQKPLQTDTDLRKIVAKLIEKKQAKVAETSIAIARPGERSRVESVQRKIYPTEYDYVSIVQSGKASESDTKKKETDKSITNTTIVNNTAKPEINTATPPIPVGFEERSVGVIFEIEPTIGAGSDPNYISLEMDLEVTKYVGDDSYGKWKGERSEINLTMPKFYTLNLKTGITGKSGSYIMAGVLSPKDKNGNTDPSKKVMVFIRSIIKVAQ